MIFSSVIFNWIFLPLTLGAYYLVAAQPWQKEETAQRAKNIVLLVASLVFYGLGGYKYLLILLAVLIINYVAGIFIGKLEGGASKAVLIAAAIADIAILFVFKYLNIFVLMYENLTSGLSAGKIWNNIISLTRTGELAFTDIILPIGISFYIFQSISYVADVRRGEAKVQKNFIDYALYVSFFPQLIAGPIVKYSDIEGQIRYRHETTEQLSEGITRFIYGISKKVLIANVVGGMADEIWKHKIGGLGAGVTWLAAISYTLQIYYDFSGYSDMAIGLGRIFGFEFPENFKYPYLSTSISEFWRRWHITLGTWFREYLYIPLGGNRKGNARTYLNLFIVFAVTGLWHGANMTFVVWGLYHGFFMIIERLGFSKVLKKCKPLAHVYAVLVFVIGWVLFRAKDLHTGLTIIKRMVLPWKYTVSSHVMTMLSVQSILALILGIIGCGILQRLCETKAGAAVAAKWKNSAAEMVFLFVILFYSMILLASGAYNPFIYFQF
jgi:alginate O-acetyltransferase complex protein AlgI